MTYGSCTLYCSWLCRYLHIPLLIFVCYIQSMKQTWGFVSETNKARSKSKTLVFIPIVFLRAIISLEDFSCLSYLHRLMSPLIVEQWPLMQSHVMSPLMVLAIMHVTMDFNIACLSLDMFYIACEFNLDDWTIGFVVLLKWLSVDENFDRQPVPCVNFEEC